MKGLARTGKGQVGWVDKPRPTAGPRDAIVRPLAMAPCTSEIHMIWGDLGDYMPSDRIMGHEAVGIVDEVGNEVCDFKPGDRVIVPAITPTFGRVPSQRGYAQHCDGMCSGMPFCTAKDGVFADYFHVNEADANLAHLPDSISLEQAVMIGDMMTTGFYGAELADIQLGSTVAVFGIGPVGLMGVAGAHLMGAARILAVGSRPNAVKVAREYGATEIIDYHNGDTVEQIMDLTGGEGVDSAVTAGGDVSTIGQAVQVLKPGGTLGNVNVMEHAENIPIPLGAWGGGLGDKTIRGGLCPGGRARMERLAALVEHGRIDPSLLLTHRFTNFADIEQALYLMHEKPKDLIKPAVILE